jgi:hypothetical protein
MYEPKPADPGEKPKGPCVCKELDMKDIPDATKPFRELLDTLSDRVKELAKDPSEATTKFPDELKDAEKEYQGIDAIVAKYKEFYDKQLDCRLADVKRWRESIEKWSTIDEHIKKAIEDYRAAKYDKKQKTICCDTWLELRRKLNDSSDCLVQARNTEAQKQEAYDKLKGFLDALTKIFGDLESLFKKAETYNKEQKPKSVYAVFLEFRDLSKLIDWPKTDEEECKKQNGGTGAQSEPGTPRSTGGYAQQPPTTPPAGGYATTPPPSGGGYGQSQEPPSEGTPGGHAGGNENEHLKKKLSPAEFRSKLISALRDLLLAKFHRLLLHHELLKNTANAEAAKKECDKFRADRQKLFLDLVEEIPTGSGSGAGNGGGEPGKPGGGYRQQPPPPGGGQEQQPPTRGYQQQPPGGGQEQ